MKATIKDGTIHLEGTGSEIAGVLATLVEEPESCSITGRSCDTCKHKGACYGCGVHLANYEPELNLEGASEYVDLEPEPVRNCTTCRYDSNSFQNNPCFTCAMSSGKPYSNYEPTTPSAAKMRGQGEWEGGSIPGGAKVVLWLT